MAAANLSMNVDVDAALRLDVHPGTRAALLELGWVPPDQTPVTRWWRNGDHPRDGVGEPRVDEGTGETYLGVEGAVVRFFRHPDVPGSAHCAGCGRTMHDHGWIDQGPDGLDVCPGDLVITRQGRYLVVPPPAEEM